MILDVEERRLIVVSDLHLGSPASSAAHRLPEFIAWVGEQDANLCINGDGFDLLQSSLTSLIASALPVVRQLRELYRRGRRIYYIVGNHDIAFEHLLADLPIVVSPFLNLRSGSKRIRVEHGHLYEPFYARHPRLYEFGGRLARPLLLAHKDTYALWARAQVLVDERRRRVDKGGYPHHQAAAALFERGFDAVVLGHTHHRELTQLEDGIFVNSGSWMTGGTWVDINDGHIALRSWPEDSRPVQTEAAPPSRSL